MMEFQKYHKIKVLGDEDNKNIFSDPEDEVVIQEKLDGGNFRFMFKNGQIIMGSRTRELDEDNPNTKGFKRCIEFVRKQIEESGVPLKNFEHLIFYGECMVQHTYQYNWEIVPPYLGFDIKNMETGDYVRFSKAEKIFKQLGLPFVPIVALGEVRTFTNITEKDIPVSKYAHPADKNFQLAEGIMIKNYSKQSFAKIVREEFKEKAKMTFGDSKKWARQKGDNELLVATYCTNARIEKMIFKLIDQGANLEMKLMETLPKKVTEDIYEEHWKEICFSNWAINFKDIRKKITGRCLAILKQMITNSSLEQEDVKEKERSSS